MTDRIERELSLPAPARGGVGRRHRRLGWLADEVALELAPGGEARFRSGDAIKTGWVEEARRPDGRRPAGWRSGGRPTASPRPAWS